MKLFFKKTNNYTKHNLCGFPARHHAGFTLMEVMVSISIFAIIITIGIGSLLTTFKTLQQTRADRQALDSVSYIMDTMTRRIRTAQEITVRSDEIKLIDQDNKEVTYSIKFDTNNSQPNTTYYLLTTTDSEINDGQPYDLTPQDFKITNMGFEQVNDQLLIYIRLAGIVKNGTRETKVSLQTAVSKRLLEQQTTPTNNNNRDQNQTNITTNRDRLN